MLRRRLLVSSIGMINRTRSGLWVITFENINSQGHEVLSTQRVSSNGAGEPAGIQISGENEPDFGCGPGDP